MEAIDRQIAERVFKWEWREVKMTDTIFGSVGLHYHIWWNKRENCPPDLCLDEKGNYETDYTPPFSSNIAMAFEVVKYLEGFMWVLNLKKISHVNMELDDDGRIFLEDGKWYAWFEDPETTFRGMGDTPAEAICSAAIQIA